MRNPRCAARGSTDVTIVQWGEKEGGKKKRKRKKLLEVTFL